MAALDQVRSVGPDDPHRGRKGTTTMTALASSTLDTSAARPILSRTPVRYALVAAAGLAPLAQFAWSFIGPYEVTDTLPESYAKIVEQPFLFELNLATQPFFGLFAVISALIVGAALRPGAPVLATIATTAAVIGGSVGWAGSAGPAVLAAARAGMPVDEALALSASVEGQIGSLVTFVAFPLIPLGYLLFGLAAVVAAKRGRFPLWAAIVLLVAVTVILVGGNFGRIFMIVGWAGVVIGVTAAAAVWARGARTT